MAFADSDPAGRAYDGSAPAAVKILVAGGFALQQFYLRGRYTNAVPIPHIYKWARQVHDERIAVVGAYVFLQYPLYGRDVSNYVQYVGARGPHGGAVGPTSGPGSGHPETRRRPCYPWPVPGLTRRPLVP